MSNSRLVKTTILSPHYFQRLGGISKITIHTAGGTNTLEGLDNTFSDPKNIVSTNYGVDSEGKVALFVNESERSIASDNTPNDQVAVTVEVCNSSNTDASWPVSDVALSATIDLCVDVCRRNGISGLTYTGDETGTLTFHRFFANKACPGQYIVDRVDSIVSSINSRLIDCENIASSISTATVALQTQGIISSPDYWEANYARLDYLGDFIVNVARRLA